MISIHAPARGATSLVFVRVMLLLLFQSTHPRGVRLGLYLLQLLACNFNPRTREGCDLKLYFKVAYYTDFNPRTREGCDIFAKEVSLA